MTSYHIEESVCVKDYYLKAFGQVEVTQTPSGLFFNRCTGRFGMQLA